MTYDEHSLISWLESQALGAHNTWCTDCEFLKACPANEEGVRDGVLCALDAQEQAYNKTLAYLRNTRAPQLHRKLMEKL